MNASKSVMVSVAVLLRIPNDSQSIPQGACIVSWTVDPKPLMILYKYITSVLHTSHHHSNLSLNIVSFRIFSLPFTKEETMSLQRRFIPFLIVFLLSFPCYYCLQGNPPYDYLDDAYGYASSQAYDKRPWRKFGSKIMGSKRIGEVGRSLASVTTVNVNDYGAKGDGSDATEVCI